MGIHRTDHTVPLRIHIQPHTGVPLYRQIVDEVKAAFLRGAIRPGDKLPSVRELAAELAVNPTTIVKAYDTLDHERLVVRRQGQGAFVADGVPSLRPEERDELLTRLARDLAREGRRLGRSEKELTELLRRELQRLRPDKRRTT